MSPSEREVEAALARRPRKLKANPAGLIRYRHVRRGRRFQAQAGSPPDDCALKGEAGCAL